MTMKQPIALDLFANKKAIWSKLKNATKNPSTKEILMPSLTWVS